MPAPGAIDCQSHLYPPELLARLEARQEDPLARRRGADLHVIMGAWDRRVFPHHSEPAATLAEMDANGIGLTVLSINDPGPEWFGPDAGAVAREANDFLAAVIRAHPGRFAGLAALPLPDVPAALDELDRAVTMLGFRGLLLYTNLLGRFPDEAAFRPLFARAVQLDAPVFLHPAKPVTLEAVRGYEMTSALGNMFEDTLALTRLILSGVFDEFPSLRLVCPHLGGALPFLIGRLDHQTQVLRRGPTLRRRPSDYLRDVWFDVVSPLPEAIRMVHALVGPERLLFASDHPWVRPAVILEALRRAGLPADDEAAILRDNAVRLLRL
jgi:predicted TIM-barrel fold metal-dependent hydrolase